MMPAASRRFVFALALALGTAAQLGSRPAGALCFAPRVLLRLFHGPALTLDPAGGLVVAYAMGWAEMEPSRRWYPREGIEFPTLRLVRGGRRVPLRAEPLGDHIVRYVPASAPAPGVWHLEGLQGRHEVTVEAAPHALLPAPVFTGVARGESVQRMGSSQAPTRVVSVLASLGSLETFAPTEAVALLVYLEGSPQAATVRPVLPRTPHVSLFLEGRCGGDETPSRAALTAGAHVTFRWVDARGGLSPLSAPYTIEAPPQPQP